MSKKDQKKSTIRQSSKSHKKDEARALAKMVTPEWVEENRKRISQKLDDILERQRQEWLAMTPATRERHRAYWKSYWSSKF